MTMTGGLRLCAACDRGAVINPDPPKTFLAPMRVALPVRGNFAQQRM